MFVRGKDRAREVCKRVNPNNAKQNKRVFKEREVFLASEIITSGEISSEVWRTLQKLELFSAAPRATVTLL